jgi:hypothetical protein
VHDEDGPCLVGDGRRHGVGVQAQGLVDVREHGNRPGHEDHLDVGDEGEGRDDDLVAGADTASRQGRGHGGRAAGADVGVLAAEAFRELLLEGQRLPVAVARAVEAITHEHPGVEDILDLAALFISEYFESWHQSPPLAPNCPQSRWRSF